MRTARSNNCSWITGGRSAQSASAALPRIRQKRSVCSCSDTAAALALAVDGVLAVVELLVAPAHRRKRLWQRRTENTEAGITAYDLDHVGISRDPGANLHKKVLFALRRRPSFNLIRDRLANAAKVRDPRGELIQGLGLEAASLRG